MAIGSSQIGTLNMHKANIDNYLKNDGYMQCGLPDEFNTFEYVVDHLREWADETAIGNEALGDLQTLNNGIKQLIDNSLLLSDTIQEFIDKQIAINNGSN